MSVTSRPAPIAPAFTLIEILMAVSILGVLAAGSWRVIQNDLQRSRLNAVSMEFAAWVESIRKAAQRTQGGCEISVSNLANAADGTLLASVRNLRADDSACATNGRFLFQAPSRDGRLSSRATNAVFTFTPRGTILGAGPQALPDQVEVKLALKGISQLRCLRLSGLLGALQLGANSTTADVSSNCTAYARF